LTFAEICGESLNLGAGFVERAGAIDGVAGALEFLFHGKLYGYAAEGFRFAHAASAEAFELLFWCAPGDDEPVEPCGHTGFDEQCGFDKYGGVSATCLPVVELLENNLINAGMKNGVEVRELRGIGEDNGSKFAAIDPARCVDEIGAEGSHDFAVSGLAGFHEFVRYGIGVEHGEAEFAENRRDNTFAAGDAAGEAEFQH